MILDFHTDNHENLHPNHKHVIQFYHLTEHLYNQYFTPLSPYVGNPNPFNVGSPLEGVPWKDTFVDG